MGRRLLPALLVALTALSICASANVMGVTLGKTTYDGAEQLVISNVASDVKWAVGSYKWTQVDGTWYGANTPASPGLGYNDIHREFDAMGLFFKPSADTMTFMILTGMPSTGVGATNLGYGSRKFGPGDLKIDVGSNSFGVGLRTGGLYWGTTDPGPGQPWFQIHKAQGGTDVISARDAGTLGVIEMNPQWDHVDHHTLADGDPYAYAFYKAGSGTVVPGQVTVNTYDTGVTLQNYSIYAYEITAPWEAFGLDATQYEFGASWRPDCGNDMIARDFSGESSPPVPEASTLMLALGGLPAGFFLRRRRA